MALNSVVTTAGSNLCSHDWLHSVFSWFIAWSALGSTVCCHDCRTARGSKGYCHGYKKSMRLLSTYLLLHIHAVKLPQCNQFWWYYKRKCLTCCRSYCCSSISCSPYQAQTTSNPIELPNPTWFKACSDRFSTFPVHEYHANTTEESMG